jgi:hypothetical protein
MTETTQSGKSWTGAIGGGGPCVTPPSMLGHYKTWSPIGWIAPKPIPSSWRLAPGVVNLASTMYSMGVLLIEGSITNYQYNAM